MLGLSRGFKSRTRGYSNCSLTSVGLSLSRHATIFHTRQPEVNERTAGIGDASVLFDVETGLRLESDTRSMYKSVGLSGHEHALPYPPYILVCLPSSALTFVCETLQTKASRIQESLATALERAIASASVLLREALVGRIRACEAEKQVT